MNRVEGSARWGDVAARPVANAENCETPKALSVATDSDTRRRVDDAK